jgi:serine/threonine protein kinase
MIDETLIYEPNADEPDDFTKPDIDWQDIKTGEVFRTEHSIYLPASRETVDEDSPVYDASEPLPTIPSISFRSQMETTLAGIYSRDSETTVQPKKPVRHPNLLGTENTILDKYSIKEVLAQGGFGKIYLVVDEEDYLKPLIVMKVVPMDIFSSTHSSGEFDKLKSIYKEWKVISDTYPDSVVRLLGVRKLEASNQQNLCLFMEYMAGGTLGELIDGWHNESNQLAPSQISQIINFFKQVCESVYVLHKNKLLHRDIKPANILLNKDKDKCKLGDFELLHDLQIEEEVQIAGTIFYMPPDAFRGNFTIASDVFALGATFYHCLSGKFPFGKADSIDEYMIQVIQEKPVSLLESNPLIPPELDQLILRCLEATPEDRPANVKEILNDLNRIGNFTEETKGSPLNNSAPVMLAQLLLEVLGKEDRDFLIKTLKKSGYRSKRETGVHEEEDIIEEYCYTVPPDKILNDNFTVRQLYQLADILNIKIDDADNQDEIIREILLEIGFLSGVREVPGLGATRISLENSFNNFANTTSSEECLGMVHSAFAAIEIAIDLLIRFYGQLFYQASFETQLACHANGKKFSLWTFGEKTKVLEMLCNSDSLRNSNVPEKAKSAFKEKLLSGEVFDLLREMAKKRNTLAHQTELKRFNEIRKIGQEFLTVALGAIKKITESKYIPRVVQIISLQHDVFGRHFYYGQDDSGRTEKIFTPLPLELGEIYLFFPLTNPARINPLIFPYNYKKKKKGN